MDRREFITAAALAGASLSTLGCASSPQEKVVSLPAAATAAPLPSAFDLTIAQGTDPVSLLDRGFKALGGISRYVKKDGSVVIKPNFTQALTYVTA